MTKKIAVLGAGSWGSTLASVLIENGHDVTLYTNVVEQAAELNEKHTNEQICLALSIQKNYGQRQTWKKL